MADSNPETGREHEVGILTAPLLTFDLNREIQQLRSEGRWQSGHTAKTLAKYPDLRVVLLVIRRAGVWTHIAPRDESLSRYLKGKSDLAQKNDRWSSRR